MESERVGGASSSHGEEGEYELRLIQLERQLSELLMKSKVSDIKTFATKNVCEMYHSSILQKQSCKRRASMRDRLEHRYISQK